MMNKIYIKNLKKSFAVDAAIGENISVYFADNTIEEGPAHEVCTVEQCNEKLEFLKITQENNEKCINVL